MAPKNKGKKSKKYDDDDAWDKLGETVAGNNTAASPPPADDEESSAPKKSSFSAFAALDGGDEQADEEDDGGLMSTLKAHAKKGKKEKKKNRGFDALADEEPGAAEVDADALAVESKAPVQLTAEELADEEWGPAKDKGKKKKGKKGKSKKEEEQEELAETGGDVQTEAGESKNPVELTAEQLAEEEWGPAKEKGKGKKGKKGKDIVEEPAPVDDVAKVDDDEEGDDEPGAKMLSKKEKEKLKKERERAKKKAQAAAKKGVDGDSAPAPSDVTPSVTVPKEKEPEAEKDEGDEDEGAGGGKSDKKKKKKKAKKEEDVPAAPPAAASKKKGGISALKALMEEKKRLEEEQLRIEEEERLRIEEEERRADEEEKRKADEKARRREKEKAKKEIAKKEGRLLTKKQKEERAAAEIRRQALLASGVTIEGLQSNGASSATGPRKVVYGNRKKKTPGDAKSPVAEDKPKQPADSPTPEVHTPATEASELPPPSTPDVKDGWDDSDAEERADNVKSDWDASSDDEEKSKSVPVVVKKPPPSATTSALPASSQPASGKVAPSSKAPTAKPVSNGAPAAKRAPSVQDDESSEEESSNEDEDGSEDEDDSSEEESSSEEDSSDSGDGMTNAERLVAQRKAEAAQRRANAHEAALAARSKDDLRSPICCILGHVDTGKTKILDKIRQTNVQDNEAGGITQQIGATFFPADAIKAKTAVLNKDGSQEYKIPGLLIIDTPGHESFTNLRTRGSSLCNIAVLVIDIMHGLEPQTRESIRLLRDRKTPFIVALNKIDRLYGWQAIPDNDFQSSLAIQNERTRREFHDRLQKIIVELAEQSLNSVLYYENKNFAKYVSIVPTSAHTGEGLPDMIMLLVTLTQQRMSDRLMYLSELECTVLEVKVIEGLGTTIDVVLSNGIMREGDRIVVCGLQGPIVTQVRALLTPQPLRELRVKGQYVHHKMVKAALGVKISAPDLEKAIAGSRLLVVGPEDDEDDLKDEVMADLTSLLNSVDKTGRGVCVQASTLGSLEALLDFLKSCKIPVSAINIGPVHKKDVTRCSTMLEKAKELACILCFDVPVDKDAERLADELGVKLFKADIIYHLFDAFTAYNNEMTEAKRRDAAPQAVWPCRLKIIQAFARRDPIILGVDILEGSLRVGTPLCVVKVDPTTKKKEIIDLGKITSLQINHKTMDVVKKSQAGGGVAVKIEHAVYQSAKMVGRHFDEKDELISHVTRASIDVLKTTFRSDVPIEDWALIKTLKGPLDIP